MSLLDACVRFYGLEGYSLRGLTGGVSEHTYVLEREAAESYVVRVERAGANDIPFHERVLLFLETTDYPAPAVIRASDGSHVVEYEGATLLITSFIQGVIVESHANTPASLYELGRTIGRLHSLHPVPSDLPAADLIPEHMIGWAEARLAALGEAVPLEWRYRVDDILRALAAIPSLPGAPRRLIHNDCHPGNAVRTENGNVRLIDWDGAGLGSPLLDLGFLLITADTYTPDVPCEGDSDSRVNAIVDGYCLHRCPDAAELEYLTSAIRFRVTLQNAAAFARHVERGQFDRIAGSWWEAWAAAEDTATRAQHRFDQHRVQAANSSTRQ